MKVLEWPVQSPEQAINRLLISEKDFSHSKCLVVTTIDILWFHFYAPH